MNRFSNKPSRGFTLIELLISTGLMALILTSAYAILRSTLHSQRSLAERDEILQNARVALNLLSSDLRAAVPLHPDTPFVGMKRVMEDIEFGNLDFASRNFKPTKAGESDWCEMSYFVSKQRGASSWTLWRRRDPTRDDKPLAGGVSEPLIEGVTLLAFEYYDGYEWLEQWGDPTGKRRVQSNEEDTRPGMTGMPDAVRITLSLLKPNDPVSTSATSQEASTDAKSEMTFQTIVKLDMGGRIPPTTGTQQDGGQIPESSPTTGEPPQPSPFGGGQ